MNDTIKAIALGVTAGAVSLVGITLISNKYFAAGFTVLCLGIAQRIMGMIGEGA